MGCCITMHSQVKKEGKWVWHDLEIYSERNYTLFGILDGTRSDIFKPIAPSKGFPEDSEDKLKSNCNGWDEVDVTESGVYLGYVGGSYLSLTELRTFDWTQKIPGTDYKMQDWTFVKEVLPYLEACAENYGGPDNVRIVFGYSV